MVRENEIREGELAVEMPPARDGGLVFIGRIRTPWTSRLQAPAARASRRPGLPARDLRALGAGAEGGRFLLQPRGDLLAASVAPRSRAAKPEEQQIDARHVFAALAGAADPIGTSIVKLVGIEGHAVLVRGLDCLDETPLLDLKPDRCEFTPLAPPQAGDFEAG